MKTIITMGTRHTIQHVMVRFHHIRPGFARGKARVWAVLAWLGFYLFPLLEPGGSAYAQTQAGNALAFAAVNGDYAALQNTGVAGGWTNGTANAYGFNNANYTLELWFRCTSGNRVLITDRRGDNERGQERADDLADGACFQNWFALAVDPSGYVAFWIADDATSSGTGDIQLNSPGGLIQFNEWNHVAVVKSRASGADAYLMYINGHLAAQRGALGIYNNHKTLTPANRISFTTGCVTTPVDGSVSHRIELGRWDNTSGISGQVVQYTDGRMDELRMWNVALTQDEIRDRMFDINWAAQPQHYHAMNITGSTGVTVPDNGASGYKMGFTTGSPYIVNRFDASQAPISDATGAALNEFVAEDNWGTRGIWSITNTNRSFSSGGLSMQVAADLTTANWANYNVSNRATTLNSAPGDVPTGVSQRYDQIWYNFEQGTVTPTMFFDMSVIQNTASPTLFPASNYYLLYRTGTSGPFSIVQTGASAISGNTIQFNTVALATGYYAIGLCATPVIATQPQPQPICVGSTASFSVVATGDAMTYQWQYSTDNGTTWNPQTDGTTADGTVTGSTTASLQIANAQASLSGRRYRVVITSGNCPVTSDAVPLTVDVIPSLSASATSLTICSGEAVNIDYTTVPPDQQVLVVRMPGNSQGAGDVEDFPVNTTTTPISYTYTAYVPTLSACESNTVTTVVTVNPVPIITPSVCSQTICVGETGVISFTSSVGGTTINWLRVEDGLTGSGDISESFTTAGTYTYKIWGTSPTPASCPTSGTITCVIEVNNACCDLQASIATAASTNCVTPNGSFTVTYSGSGTYQYSLNGATNQPLGASPFALTNLAAGSYTLVITDVNSNTCSTSSLIVIGGPGLTVAASSNSPVCATSTLALFATPTGATGNVTYNWAGPNGFSNTAQNPTVSNITPAATGLYSVTATDQGGCTAISSTSVTVANQPSLTISGGLSQTVCSSQATTLTVSGDGGAPVSWINSLGQTGTGTSINFAGIRNVSGQPQTVTYILLANAGTCSDRETVTITIKPAPTLQVYPLQSVICAFEQTNLTANAFPSTATITSTRNPTLPAPATRSGTGTLPVNESLPAGSYTYTFTATQDGCTSLPVTSSLIVNN